MMKNLFISTVAVLTALFSFGQTYNVTFQVDMTNQSGFTTPEVNGTFNSWCGSCFPMTDANSDGIWEATTALAAGSYEFKFSADSWTTQETLLQGSECTVTNSGFTNRTLTVGTSDMVLPIVCWGSCVSCDQTPDFFDVTFQVDMTNETGFTTPEVNGTFNGWCGNCTPMTDANADNVWEVTVTLPAGSYEYKYSYDNWNGQEELAVGSSCTVTTGAFTNRTFVADADMVLPVVCFGSCSACGQSTGPFNIVFEVDMNEVAFAFTTPEINGTFNNWCGSCAQLSDTDGDNVWTATIPLDAGTYQYKFSYDNWTGQEELAQGSACTVTETGFTNRQVIVSQNATVGVVCWESCSACGPVGVDENTALSWSVYPNPVEDNIVIAASIDEPVWIQLVDLTGRTIQSVKIQRMTQYNMDLSGIPIGMYVMQIQTSKGTFSKSVQKVR